MNGFFYKKQMKTKGKMIKLKLRLEVVSTNLIS